jgi:hypothetical protein
LEWGEDRDVAWRPPVPGRGWSSPVIAAGRVWLTTAVGDSGGVSLRVLAFDVATGEELVNVEAYLVGGTYLKNTKNSHASPTPIVEGDRAFLHFGADGTSAFSTNGEFLWETKLAYESMHGNGGSPVIYRDLLIVNCDGDDQAYVVALAAQSIVVASSATNQQGDEAAIFKAVFWHSIVLASIVGLIVMFYAYVIPSAIPG